MTPLVNWSVFVLFAAWGIGSLCSSVVRAKRYYKYQKDAWLLTDAIEKFLMAIAFLLGALIVAPHPISNFEGLRTYARLAWFCAFIPFGIGVFLDWNSMARIEREVNK